MAPVIETIYSLAFTPLRTKHEPKHRKSPLGDFPEDVPNQALEFHLGQ